VILHAVGIVGVVICVDAAILTCAARALVAGGFSMNCAVSGLRLMACCLAFVLQLTVALRGDWSGVPVIVLLGTAIVCAATDAATGYVFDGVTIPALLAILELQLSIGATPALIGTAIGGGVLFALYAGTFGRGLGLGDVKLACCIGAGLGSEGVSFALGFAFVVGGAYAAYLLLTRRGARGDEIPFAPYLASGTLAVALYRSLA
jgi:prepilin signal peptidase PulO-like enzyme (type II secretory pathway)